MPKCEIHTQSPDLAKTQSSPSQHTALPSVPSGIDDPISDSCKCKVSVKRSFYCGCPNHSQSISIPTIPYPEQKIFIPEKRKTCVVFVLFICTVLLNHFVLAVVSDIISRDPLPDLMHSLFEQSAIARPMADWFAFAGSVGTFIACCIFHKYRWIVARRLFYIGSILFLMRAASISMTHVPASYQDNTEICVEPSDEPDPSYQRVFSNFARIFLTLGLQVKDSSNRLFCGDMLFSGHTTTISTCCFFINYYMPHSLWPVKMLVISCCVIAMVCLVASRAHYTLDVVMGYWISSIVFSLYHAYCEISHEIRPQTRAFRRLFIFWTMFEVERKVPSGRLPNQLEWPLPWPKQARRLFEMWNEQSDDNRLGRTAKWLATHRLKLHM